MCKRDATERKRKILVVDDDEFQLFALSTMLSGDGHDVNVRWHANTMERSTDVCNRVELLSQVLAKIK